MCFRRTTSSLASSLKMQNHIYGARRFEANRSSLQKILALVQLLSVALIIWPTASNCQRQHATSSKNHRNSASLRYQDMTPSMTNASQIGRHFACPSGLLTFELLTGFIYKPPGGGETLAVLPSTLQLTDCLAHCLQNSSCWSINFEMGLCVLMSSSAERQQHHLQVSQFPVFTIYAEKKCLLAESAGGGKVGRRCQRSWAFERVAGYEMKTRPRRRLKLASKEQCMNSCLLEQEFECRSANWHRDSLECSLSDQDRHSISQSEAGDQQLRPIVRHFYGPAKLPAPPHDHQANSSLRPALGFQRLRAAAAAANDDDAAAAAMQPLILEPAATRTDYLENNCIQEPNKLCEFRKIQNRVLKTVDSIYQEVGSLEECKQKCLNAPYRCHSFDYGDTAERVCRTSHLDQVSLVSVSEPYLDVVGAITYELAACFNVSIQCAGAEMLVQVSSSKSFSGRIYAKSRPSSCLNDVEGALKFELRMRYNEPNCDVRASGPSKLAVAQQQQQQQQQPQLATFSNEIVIQHHDRIVTTQDVGLGVFCQYDLANRSVTNDVELAVEHLAPAAAAAHHQLQSPPGASFLAQPDGGRESSGSSLTITGLATTVVKSPNVTMRITNINGQPVSSATVGDRLALLFEVKETTSPFGIFVREIVATDGKQLATATTNSTGQLPETSANSIQFIDSTGCPTDANLMGPLVKLDASGHRLLAPFDAFKFPTSDVVFFRAVVSSCVAECKPAVCDQEPSQPMLLLEAIADQHHLDHHFPQSTRAADEHSARSSTPTLPRSSPQSVVVVSAMSTTATPTSAARDLDSEITVTAAARTSSARTTERLSSAPSHDSATVSDSLTTTAGFKDTPTSGIATTPEPSNETIDEQHGNSSSSSGGPVTTSNNHQSSTASKLPLITGNTTNASGRGPEAAALPELGEILLGEEQRRTIVSMFEAEIRPHLSNALNRIQVNDSKSERELELGLEKLTNFFGLDSVGVAEAPAIVSNSSGAVVSSNQQQQQTATSKSIIGSDDRNNLLALLTNLAVANRSQSEVAVDLSETVELLAKLRQNHQLISAAAAAASIGAQVDDEAARQQENLIIVDTLPGDTAGGDREPEPARMITGSQHASGTTPTSRQPDGILIQMIAKEISNYVREDKRSQIRRQQRDREQHQQQQATSGRQVPAGRHQPSQPEMDNQLFGTSLAPLSDFGSQNNDSPANFRHHAPKLRPDHANRAPISPTSYHSYGRRRRKRHAGGATLDAPAFVYMEQSQSEPGVRATVRMYHRSRAARLRRETSGAENQEAAGLDPLHMGPADELVIQSIRIVDRKPAEEASEEAAAAQQLGSTSARGRSMDSSERRLASARNSARHPDSSAQLHEHAGVRSQRVATKLTAFSVSLVAICFVFAQLTIIFVCLVDWRRRSLKQARDKGTFSVVQPASIQRPVAASFTGPQPTKAQVRRTGGGGGWHSLFS